MIMIIMKAHSHGENTWEYFFGRNSDTVSQELYHIKYL